MLRDQREEAKCSFDREELWNCKLGPGELRATYDDRGCGEDEVPAPVATLCGRRADAGMNTLGSGWLEEPGL